MTSAGYPHSLSLVLDLILTISLMIIKLMLQKVNYHSVVFHEDSFGENGGVGSDRSSLLYLFCGERMYP